MDDGGEVEVRCSLGHGCVAGREAREEDVGVLRRQRGRFLIDGNGLEELGSVDEAPVECRDELFPDAITAGLDAGANGGSNMARARAEDGAHHAHGFFGDPTQRPAPARVDCGDDAAARIDEQYRLAIRGSNGQEDSRLIGHERVSRERPAFWVERRVSAHGDKFDTARIPDDGAKDVSGMNLPQMRPRESGRAERRKKFPAVLLDGFPAVGFGEAEIEPAARAGARAARARGERMQQPRKTRERARLDPREPAPRDQLRPCAHGFPQAQEGGTSVPP